MDFDKIYLLSFTSNASNNNNDFPIEFNVTSISNEFSKTNLIYPEKDWTYWDIKYQQHHGISKKSAIENGITTSQCIQKINEICREKNIKLFFSSNYDFDIILLNNLLKKSTTKPLFTMKDFYSGINEYQKKLWNHLYFSLLNKNKLSIYTARERNIAFKEGLNRILKIRSINLK